MMMWSKWCERESRRLTVCGIPCPIQCCCQLRRWSCLSLLCCSPSFLLRLVTADSAGACVTVTIEVATIHHLFILVSHPYLLYHYLSNGHVSHSSL